MNQNTKETTNVEPPKLTYYQRNKATLRAKAKAKYQEKKKLGITDHQIFMRSIEHSICCPNCQHVFKKSDIKQV
jgi:hypothetical protein